VERRRPSRDEAERTPVEFSKDGIQSGNGVASTTLGGRGLIRPKASASVTVSLDNNADVPKGLPAPAIGDDARRVAPGNRQKVFTTPVSREKNEAEARGSMGVLEPTDPEDREKQPVDPDKMPGSSDADPEATSADRTVDKDPKDNASVTRQPVEPSSQEDERDNGREESGQENKIAQKVPPKASSGEVRRPLAGGQPSGPPEVKAAVLLRQIPLTPAGPGQTEPIEATMEQAQSPWNPSKRIVRVSLKAKDVPAPARPVASVVFAIDISQSMTANARLDLVREGIRRMMERLRPEDQVAIVTYADRADVALPTTLAAHAGIVRSCLAGLASAGRTNGSDGLMLAYQVARAGWIEGGLNEVVLCTDGNFNLGTTDASELGALAAEQARSGLRLSVIGFGRNDRNDLRLELLASNGGGQSGYVNTLAEAEQMLVGQINSLFAPVATNVEMQVEFRPENVLDARRLDDDAAFAGRGSVDRLLPGRSLTQLYEITPRYEAPTKEVRANLMVSCSLATTGEQKELVQTLAGTPREWSRTGAEFRYATAILELSRVLRGDPANRPSGLGRLKKWLQDNVPDDPDGYRRDLLFKVEQAGESGGI
jgi:Ca-activated chloride channel homolog